MKIGNFGSFDPILKAKGIVGLGNTSRLDKEVWDEYCDDWGKLAYDSALIIAQLRNTTLEEFTHTLPKQFPKGEERERIIRQRIHQTFFRDAVLSSYNYRCCISGVGSIELLARSSHPSCALRRKPRPSLHCILHNLSTWRNQECR